MKLKMKKLTDKQKLNFKGYFFETYWTETQANLSFLVKHILGTCCVEEMLDDMIDDSGRTLDKNIELQTLKKLIETFNDLERYKDRYGS